MTYWSEFRAGWRPLLATALGMASGMSAIGVFTSIMAAHFIRDLHWSPAAFARVGAVSIVMSAFIPVAGRLADLWGVRRTAAIGVAILPLSMIGISLMTGDIAQYYALFIIQAVFCVTTTATVYSRTIVAHFERARGLALAIAASAPGITGIVASLLLNPYVEAHGWRSGYRLCAGIALVLGITALALLPKRSPPAAESPLIASPRRRSWADYPAIFRTPAFWLLIAAMLACNLYQPLVLTQLNLLVLAQGIDKASVGGIISVFSMAMVAGRFLCGAAIDRFPGQIVAALGMGLPCVGLFLLAAGLGGHAVTVAMLFIGLAVGAEGDLIGVLVSRAFGIAIYGSVMGLVTAAISLATASGALVLGAMLARQGGYGGFLLLTGITTLLGGTLFLLLPRAASEVPD
jgi:MFS family permease